MSEISRVTAQPQITRSTTYERSQSVRVSSSVQQEGDVKTEITTRITINELKEISKTREEMEALARAQNQQTESSKQNASTEAASTQTTQTSKPTDITPQVSMEVDKDYQTSLANAPKSQSGSLLNTTV